VGRRIALGLAATAVALLLLEGAASLAVFLWHARMNVWLPLPERAHTAYDPELGWIAEPNARVPDLYGPGLSLTTNARGFRNAGEFASDLPDGATRAVAIGDSFTLGFGVGDADTWPARLERECPRVEVPNLGQAGYGVDQSVLHYVRATRDFAHQVAIAAFIADDFSRVRSSQMVLYGKPVFRLRDGQLHLENVPVPRAPYLAPWLTQNLRLLESLRSVELGRRLASAFGAERVAYVPTPEDETTRVIAQLLAEFARTAHERSATPVLVLLPSLAGVDPEEFAPLPDYARAALREATQPALVTFDLQLDFEAVPTSQRGALFLTGPRSRGAGAHYSTAGNTLVARAIARRLGDAQLLPPGACAQGSPGVP
jgi:hypothetical protein